MNKKTSIIAAGIALAAITTIGASSATPAQVRSDLRLKAPTERILMHQVRGSEIDYDYISDEVAPEEYYFANGSHYSGAKITKRVILATGTKNLENVQVEFNGEQVFKDDSSNKILRIHQHATTSVDAWDQQTKKSLLERLISLVTAQSAYATVDTYTTSTTWVAPGGVTAVQAEVWAGGGSGGIGTNATGGGGGGYSKANAVAVTPGNSYTVTVGTGGAKKTATGAAQNGNSGNSSWFSTSGTVLACGGGGGGGSNTTPGTAAGGSTACGIGDVKHAGGDSGGASGTGASGGGGGAGSSADGASSGAAASGVTGGGAGGSPDGGNGSAGVRDSGTSDGTDGSTLGGGSGGRCANNNHTTGDGARGQVVLTYTAAAPSTGNNEFFWYSNDGL